ncbi:MAG: alpha-N-acetylglucosaminidase [Bacteroidales bacterium]|nr:alpha-N-acetylglucosaminidase [Bacteroidales bacterium]
MKRTSLIAFAILTVSACVSPDERSAMELAERIVPAYADNISFVQTEDTVDVFELSMKGNRLVIKGNNANSMAVGLNHYLKNTCDVTVSWHAYDTVQYPMPMPVLDEPVRAEARVDERFFLNYCTFGYTMPWWKWEDWERLIDWMALNGVTMPLANTGQEAVWQKVWRKHGLTDEQIRSYFTGPAHLAWHRMCNIDSFDGPLPQGWIDSQVDLQKKILERERALNMMPVLSAFGGHVPEQLKDIYPDARITDIPGWGGFDEEYLCHFLAPMDTLYARIQKEFMEEQERMFGTDHIYGVDLFNEVEAPSWDPETLAAISKGAYESMAAVDPDAKWLQMGWMFYYDQKHWTKENVEAYLRAVPQDKVIILDYYLEHTPVWTLTDSFYGQPYILCYLGNFGGNVRLAGHFHQTGERIEDAFARGGDNLIGLGSTLEGFGVNQFMYEYLFDKAWNTGISDDEWVKNLADRRLGKPDENARKAWKTLTDSVYISGSFSSQTPLACARPCLEGFWHWTAIHNVKYDNATLIRAWKDLLASPSDRDSYRFDIVNIGTQVLGNHFAVLRDEFTAAYRSGDVLGAETTGRRMLELIDDMDALAACEPQLRLDRWLDDAAAYASAPDEEAYYRRNARTIITVWGYETSIRDYASRLWSGLLDSYCKPRWEMFIEEILLCMREKRQYDEKAFFEKLTEFENRWAAEEQQISFRSPSDHMKMSSDFIAKYDF